MTDSLTPGGNRTDDICDVDIPFTSSYLAMESSAIIKPAQASGAHIVHTTMPTDSRPRASTSSHNGNHGHANGNGLSAHSDTHDHTQTAGTSHASHHDTASSIDDTTTTHGVPQDTVDKEGFRRSMVEPPQLDFSELTSGAALIKYGRYGKPHLRSFILNEERTVLSWSSPKKKTTKSMVTLSDVSAIRLGRTTAVFDRFKKEENLEHLSFSLIYAPKDRSLDLVCRNKAQYNVWVRGLSEATGIDPA